MTPRMKTLGSLGVAILLALTTAQDARAQFVKNLVKSAGVTASVGYVHPVDSDVDAGAAFGLSLSLAPSSGWGVAGNLGWFAGDLRLDGTKVGTAHVRPLMLGVGYGWTSGRVTTSASLTAGVSFNSTGVDPKYRDAFGPGTSVDLHMDNSWCVRPSLKVEYAITPKFAVAGWTSYFITKINSSLVTPLGTVTDKWNATSFIVSAGVTFYPFK